METPHYDTGTLTSSSTSAPRPKVLVDRIDREALRFLGNVIIPELVRRKERELASRVQRAARSEDLTALGRWKERDRRSVLEAIEAKVAKHTEHPRAVVRLAAILGVVAAPDVRFARWRTVPAR